MVKNYLTILVRNTFKSKIYTAINVIGFSVGIACVILIALYIQYELSYDTHHQNQTRIYRITEKLHVNGSGEESASVPIPTGPTLQHDYAHLITKAVRFFSFGSSTYLEFEDKRFNEKELFFADSSVFDVFDFELSKGNAHTALREPNQIIITEELASRYFGKQDPIGKVMRYEEKVDLNVVGVLKEIPTNSHLKFNALLSFPTLNSLLSERQLGSFFWNPAYTYLLLKDDSDKTRTLVQEALPVFIKKYFNEVKVSNKQLSIQPLTDIHLHSAFENEIEPGGNVTYIYTLGTVGILILILAIINFVNLSTARAIHRAKEVGVRKVLGSRKRELVTQFLTESILFAFVATVLAVLLAGVALPFLNEFLNKNISFTEIPLRTLVATLTLLVILVGILSGLYPAVYLSSFQPIEVLKGKFLNNFRGTAFRKTLVVFQFTIAVALISGAIIVSQQLSFLQTTSTGFNRDKIIVIPIQRSALSNIETFRAFRERLLTNKDISHVTAVEEIPGKAHNAGAYSPEGTEEPLLLSRLFVREDFLQTFYLQLIAGKNFNELYIPNRTFSEVIVNESLVKELGWSSPEEALGKKMGEYKRDSIIIESRVVGVVRDFHVTSLHAPVKSFVLEGPPTEQRLNAFMIKYMAIKLSPGNSEKTLDDIERAWNNVVPDKVFEFTFLDEELQAMYIAETQFSKLSHLFSALAIAVACLGLFGLTSYTVEKRSKEISIRKVLGSSSSRIILLLSSDFIKAILIANVIAIPFTYWALQQWLQNFAYHISIHAYPFVMALILTFITAFITISFQTMKAALINPARTLRSD